ncbi:hypothetical protein ACFL4Z_02250 [candidate division KSB1 bacterium]
MEYINLVLLSILLFFQGFLSKALWDLNKTNKATINDFKDRLELYDPKKVNELIEEMKKLNDKETLFKVNKILEDFTNKVKGPWLEKKYNENVIFICNLIKDGSDLNGLIEVAEKRIKELKKEYPYI